MKKLILTFIALIAACSLQAQNINPGGDHEQRNIDEPTMPTHADSLSGWVLDINVMVGGLNQQYTYNNLTAKYINPLNPSEGKMQYDNGMSYGFEAQGGYFFGRKQHWGVGFGLTYLYQTGNVTVDNFHVEYASFDDKANIFRQEVTATHQIKETIHTSSFNIPIVAKYQTRISKKVGFTADAGILFNLHVQNYYKTNAAFDYEAIYQYTGVEGAIKTAYDAGTPPAASDLLITKAGYTSTVPGSTITNYFNTLKSDGYNVGLNQSPTNNKGSVSYMSGSVGLLIRPAISIDLCSNLALNLGVYYYYQNFSNKALSNYHVTDKVGEYSSVLNTVTNAVNNSYGITVGVRYSFCKRPEAPVEMAPEPEPTPEVTAPTPEAEDAEPVAHVDISTPLLFDNDKVTIKESSIPILEEAVKELKANPKATLTIHGYTDNTGKAEYNKRLSRRRAAVVKEYLRDHGVNPKILKAIGHGQAHPEDSNKTKEGRMRNRRVIMQMDDE